MRVHKAFAEAQWPSVADKFPEVEISFADEDERGDAELIVTGGTATVESVAHAMGVVQTVVTPIKPDRPAVSDDFIDHGREQKMIRIAADAGKPPTEVGAGPAGEVVETEEAPAPKQKRAAKKKAAKKKGA